MRTEVDARSTLLSSVKSTSILHSGGYTRGRERLLSRRKKMKNYSSDCMTIGTSQIIISTKECNAQFKPSKSVAWFKVQKVSDIKNL